MWGTPQKEAEATLKQALTQAPALSLPDPKKAFQLYVHEREGIASGVLTQRLGSEPQPVAYLPKRLDLCAGQEAAVRTEHGTIDWFQIRKGICQGCILSPCLFNLYAEYIMRNTGLEEAQAGIKIAGRNINNLRYAGDTTLMAESEEELKSLVMKVKEESEKVALKLNIQKTKIMASGPITSWEIDGETVETVSDFIFGGVQNHCRW